MLIFITFSKKPPDGKNLGKKSTSPYFTWIWYTRDVWKMHIALRLFSVWTFAISPNLNLINLLISQNRTALIKDQEVTLGALNCTISLENTVNNDSNVSNNRIRLMRQLRDSVISYSVRVRFWEYRRDLGDIALCSADSNTALLLCCKNTCIYIYLCTYIHYILAHVTCSYSCIYLCHTITGICKPHCIYIWSYTNGTP